MAAKGLDTAHKVLARGCRQPANPCPTDAEAAGWDRAGRQAAWNKRVAVAAEKKRWFEWCISNSHAIRTMLLTFTNLPLERSHSSSQMLPMGGWKWYAALALLVGSALPTYGLMFWNLLR